MRVLLVVSIAASLLMIGVGMIVALLPDRVINLSGSMQDVGFLASAFALSYLLAQMPIGYLADRLGAKPFLVFGYMLAAVSGVVFYSASTPESIFLGRFIQGAGEAPIWALGPALLSLAYPHAKGKVIGIYNASIHIGLTIGPLLGIYLFLNNDSGAPFLLFTALCLSGGLLVLLFLPRITVAAIEVVGKVPTLAEFVGLLNNREPLITLLGVLIYGAGYGICISVLPATLAISKGFDSVSNGIYFALFYVSISIAQLIIGPLSDRHGRLIYMLFGLVLSAAGFSSFSLFTYPWIYAPLTVASIGLGVFCVSSMAFLNECVPPSLKSTISASYYLAWGLGYFLGPLLVGGFGGGYLILAALMLFEVTFIFIVMRS